MPFIGDPRTRFSVHVQVEPDASAITLRGDLQGGVAWRLQPAFEVALAGAGPVVVDLRAVSGIDVEALHALTVFRRRLARQTRRLTVLGHGFDGLGGEPTPSAPVVSTPTGIAHAESG